MCTCVCVQLRATSKLNYIFDKLCLVCTYVYMSSVVNCLWCHAVLDPCTVSFRKKSSSCIKKFWLGNLRRTKLCLAKHRSKLFVTKFALCCAQRTHRAHLRCGLSSILRRSFKWLRHGTPAWARYSSLYRACLQSTLPTCTLRM